MPLLKYIGCGIICKGKCILSELLLNEYFLILYISLAGRIQKMPWLFDLLAHIIATQDIAKGYYILKVLNRSFNP